MDKNNSVTTSARRIQLIRRTKNIEQFVFPKYCLMGFFPSLYGYIKQKYPVQVLDFINPRHPYYLFSKDNHDLAFIFPGMGAPFSGAILDETIALGAQTILCFGLAGALHKENENQLILPIGAMIDEGTSKQYLSTNPIVYPDLQLVSTIESSLLEKRIPFSKGLTWTTDAPYRETAPKILQMKKEGCIAVEMEASALFSIAKYYHKKIAGFFLPSDFVSESSWEIFHTPSRPKQLHPNSLFELATEILSNYILKNKKNILV